MADKKTERPDHEAENGLHVVKLNKRFLTNHAGEVCGFSPEIAAELVEKKHAEYVKAHRSAPPALEAKPAK